MIRLARFSEDNAEIVLSWRNKPEIRMNFIDNREISLNNHLKFISNTFENNQHFFILNVKNKPHGVLNVNKLNAHLGLWGCYLTQTERVMPGIFPLMIAISGKFAFEYLNLKTLNSEVIENNTAPHRINKFLEINSTNERTERRYSGELVNIVCYELNIDQWPKVKRQILKLLPQKLSFALKNFNFEENITP